MSKNIRNTSQGIINIITSNPSNTSWNTLGNTGINVATNYIGTTDNTPLLLTTNGDLTKAIKVSIKSQLEFLLNNIKIKTGAGNSSVGNNESIYIGNGCG